MGYCVMVMSKIKTMKDLAAAYNHDYRVNDTYNADKDKKHLNHALVEAPEDGYLGALRDKVKSLDYYKDHDLRKNGVHALELVLSFSREDMDKVDLEQWEKDNADWVRKTFNANPEKYGDNLVSLVFHYDETGNVHGHAIIIPVDDKGKINASYYLKGEHGSKQRLSEMQTSYANAMKKHGLTRGITGSKASHEDIKRFYTKLNDAVFGVKLPSRQPGDTDRSYLDKVIDAWRTERAAHLRELYEKDREITELKSTYLTYDEKDRKIEILEKENKKLKEDLLGFEREFGSAEKGYELAGMMSKIYEGLANLEDAEKAKELSGDIMDLIRIAEDGRKKSRKKGETELDDDRGEALPDDDVR